MSNERVGDQAERRVTAGLRGASWDTARLPHDMCTRVFATRTSDGAQINGYLHSRGGERSAVMIMHPRELLVTHYLVPYLLEAGYACWVQGARAIGNDLRLEHETAIIDVAAGAATLRDLGFKKIVMLGNSGGAALFAFYNDQALRDPSARIARSPGGRPTKLDQAVMPEVDGFVFVAPHPGQGILLMNAIDPSVTDERDPSSADPSLYPFMAENGFGQAEEGGAHYSAEFLARYKAAQHARVERIDAFAREAIHRRMEARKKGGEAKGADALNAYLAGVFNVWRTDADLRCFDLSLEPSDRRWGSVWGANPLVSNVGSVGFARVCTPESWLSTWSGLSSNASFAQRGGSIHQPTLTIFYTGDNSVFPGDADGIVASIASSDHQVQRIRGNHHGQSLRLDEQNGQEIAGVRAADWLKERFPASNQRSN